MRDDDFEWDDDKAESNRRKHGVTFDEAREVFRGEPHVEDHQVVDYEERWSRIGPSSRRLLVVVYTVRGDPTHIITTRRAQAHEHDRYRRETRP